EPGLASIDSREPEGQDAGHTRVDAEEDLVRARAAEAGIERAGRGAGAGTPDEPARLAGIDDPVAVRVRPAADERARGRRIAPFEPLQAQRVRATAGRAPEDEAVRRHRRPA